MATVILQGMWLHDPDDPGGTVHQFVFNGDGAREETTVQSVRTQYAGRRYDVVDYGEDETRTVSVDVADETGSGDLDAARAFLAARTTLCYRDAKSRLLYGQITVSGITDQFWGQSFTVGIEATDFTPAPYTPAPVVDEVAPTAADEAALAAADAELAALLGSG